MANESQIPFSQAAIDFVQHGGACIPSLNPFVYAFEYVPTNPDGTENMPGQKYFTVTVSDVDSMIDTRMLSLRQFRKGHAPFMQIVPTQQNGEQDPYQQAL